MERISIFGLGYVGTVCAACFSQMGHNVIGVDPNATKLDLIASGRPPIIEAEIDQLVSDGVTSRRLSVTSSVEKAVAESNLSIICVGTPSAANGSLNLDAVRKVTAEIGVVLAGKATHHIVVVRSTVLPGTLATLIQPTLEGASGKRVGEDIGLAVNPEFLREGSAVSDFYHPTRTIVGSADVTTASRVMALYGDLPGEKIITNVETAELVKYVDNAWHALKVAFGNEVGTLCKSIGIDSHKLMDIFIADTKLNISAAYLKPGFAFGGSCLPKDLRALNNFAISKDADLPVVRNILKSNDVQFERALNWILSYGVLRITFLGLSFKSGTDDLRESPYVDLVERLIGKGCNVRIYDAYVEMGRLLGANRDYLLERIPHVAELLVTEIETAMLHGQIIVVTQRDPIYSKASMFLRDDQRVLDFSYSKDLLDRATWYDGFSW